MDVKSLDDSATPSRTGVTKMQGAIEFIGIEVAVELSPVLFGRLGVIAYCRG